MRMHRTLATSALALLVAATLAACGGDGDDGTDVATLGDGETAAEDDTTSDSGSELSDAEREDAMLEFTECMRDNGVDMPDPGGGGPGGGGGRIEMGFSSEDGGPEQEEFEAAQEACGDILDDAFGDRPQMSPEEEAEMQDNMLAFSACMRENGVDMPDPEFDGTGRGGVIMRSGGEGMDPEDPDFAAAEEACRSELGFEEGEGPKTNRDGPVSSSGKASSSGSSS